MDSLRKRVEDQVIEEENASGEYIDLANDLYDAGLPKSEAIKIFNIARDERRHYETLKALLRKLS